MDTTLLVLLGVTIASVLVIAIAASIGSKTGKFALAGPGRTRRVAESRVTPATVAAPPAASPSAASAASRSALSASSLVDLPLASAPDLPPPFASPSQNNAELAVERLQARMDARFDALERDVRNRLEAIARDLAAVKDAEGATVAAIEARQSAALREFRAEIAPLLMQRAQAEAFPLASERRADASAELYGMVARLESAISQVTNPILLPGEAYAPPVDFFAEALAWENWKDVGERAFALADAFSARRLYLSDTTATAVAAFVTTLRGVLTRSVYPNLVPDATAEQLDTLRSAMGALAAELPKVRRVLEAEFRSASAGNRPS